MRVKSSTPDTVVLCVLAALVVGGLVLGGRPGSGGDSRGGRVAGAEQAARRVTPIAHHIEEIRGLRFKRLPRPVIVSAAQTRADALRDLDKHGSARERRVDAKVLELLGLLEPGTDLRAVAGDVSGEQVAGYYDTERKRLAIVAGPGAADSLLSEITLAHELDHALDDQRFGIHDLSSAGADDSASAYTALVEGVATAVMDEYARRFADPGRALGSLFTALGPSASSTEGIPPYVLSSLLFSYVAGERFVSRLRDVAGGGWKLVDYALRSRPPVSTEQVIHPDKYLVNEKPVRVRVRGVSRLVPASWRRLTHGTIGEFDTDELLKLGVSDGVAGDAAAGWGGGTYSLWGTRDLSSTALVLAWAWDTPSDASEFERALREYARQAPGGGAAAVRARGLHSALAIAPSRPRAQALAGAQLRFAVPGG